MIGASVGVSIKIGEIGLTTGEIAGKSGVTMEDRIGFATPVGDIGANVETRLVTGDNDRPDTASVGIVLSSGVVSAGSIAATGEVSAGIGL